MNPTPYQTRRLSDLGRRMGLGLWTGLQAAYLLIQFITLL